MVENLRAPANLSPPRSCSLEAAVLSSRAPWRRRPELPPSLLLRPPAGGRSSALLQPAAGPLLLRRPLPVLNCAATPIAMEQRSGGDAVERVAWISARRQIRLEDVRLWMLHVKRGECVAVNCILTAHRLLRDDTGACRRSGHHAHRAAAARSIGRRERHHGLHASRETTPAAAGADADECAALLSNPPQREPTQMGTSRDRAPALLSGSAAAAATTTSRGSRRRGPAGSRSNGVWTPGVTSC